jgi:hypothetical protein
MILNDFLFLLNATAMGILLALNFFILIISGSDDDIVARNELHASLVKYVKQQNLELTLGRLNVFEYTALAQDLAVWFYYNVADSINSLDHADTYCANCFPWKYCQPVHWRSCMVFFLSLPPFGALTLRRKFT